jgi:hypothetical protein
MAGRFRRFTRGSKSRAKQKEDKNMSSKSAFALALFGAALPVQVSIPDFVTEAELGQFLDNLFHQDATPSHSTVTRVR